jgi:hypothetical protein
MIPVLSVAPAPQTTATTPLSITTSTETSRQYPRGQRRQSNLGRVWQRRFGGNRCRNFPEDQRHSVAGSSGRISTRFRKWSGLRQSPQVTYDRSCGSPIRKAGVNLVHHDLGDNFPMALRRDAEQILTVFRNPAKLGVFSIKDGALVSSLGGVRSSLSRIHSDLDVILKHANASPGRSRQGRTSHFARAETDCVAGVIGLELRNPSAIHVFEMS